MSPETISRNLDDIIRSATSRLRAVPEESASVKPAPGKWSLKEELGHLIDSASNNHHRFVRMQEVPNIGAFRYSQNHWVETQHWADEPWSDIVDLWNRYNLHLVRVISFVKPESLGNLCDVGDPEPATLEFIMKDYLRHVEHHLEHIFAAAALRGKGR